MRHVHAAVRLGSMLTVLCILAGCIAHVSVNVPPLEVRVEGTDKTAGTALVVDVVAAEFYGEMEALTALVTDGIKDKYPSYERQTLRMPAATTTPLIFPGEDRYIGFMLIPPSEDTKTQRTVFFRVGANGDIHRVEVSGSTATVRKTNLAHARAALPPILQGVRPAPPSPRWDTWFEAERKFNDSLEWEQSSELSIVDLRRTPERDVLVVKINGAS